MIKNLLKVSALVLVLGAASGCVSQAQLDEASANASSAARDAAAAALGSGRIARGPTFPGAKRARGGHPATDLPTARLRARPRAQWSTGFRRGSAAGMAGR